MDLIWREHKKFILGVIAALVAGLVFHAFAVAPARAEVDRMRQDLQSVRATLAARLESEGQPTEDTLARAREDVQRLEADVTALAQDLTAEVPKEFGVPKGERNPAFYFDTQLNRVRQDFKRRAPKVGSEGLKLPTDESYGFPKQVTEKGAAECLARLALLHRVLSVVFDAGVQEISAIQAFPGSAANAEIEGPPAGVFLQRRRVEIRLKGRLSAVVRILHGLGQKGSFLALEKCVLTKEDSHAEIVTAEIGVSGVSVNRDGALKGSTPAQGAAPASGGGRGGYRRR